MTIGELLDLIEASAKRYRGEALSSITRNSLNYGLSKKDVVKIRSSPRRMQRVVDAILVDFINHFAEEHGGDRGERAAHLRS